MPFYLFEIGSDTQRRTNPWRVEELGDAGAAQLHRADLTEIAWRSAGEPVRVSIRGAFDTPALALDAIPADRRDEGVVLGVPSTSAYEIPKIDWGSVKTPSGVETYEVCCDRRVNDAVEYIRVHPVLSPTFIDVSDDAPKETDAKLRRMWESFVDDIEEQKFAAGFISPHLLGR